MRVSVASSIPRALLARVLPGASVLVAGLFGPAGASAQGVPVTPEALDRGDRIRVESPVLALGRGEGTVEALRGDTILLRLEHGVRAVPFRSLERLRVRTGEHRATLRGAFVGAVVGLLTGFVIKGADEADDEIDPECGELECHGPGLFLGTTLGGAAIGGAIGWHLRVGEWTEVPVLRWERVGVEVIPGPAGGLRATVRIRR